MAYGLAVIMYSIVKILSIYLVMFMGWWAIFRLLPTKWKWAIVRWIRRMLFIHFDIDYRLAEQERIENEIHYKKMEAEMRYKKVVKRYNKTLKMQNSNSDKFLKQLSKLEEEKEYAEVILKELEM